VSAEQVNPREACTPPRCSTAADAETALRPARSPHHKAPHSNKACAAGAGAPNVAPTATEAKRPSGKAPCPGYKATDVVDGAMVHAPVRPGVHSAVLSNIKFEVADRYSLQKVVGKGSYGAVA
jgi:hypothetical protein